MNCAKTIEVVQLAIELREKRYQKACELIVLLIDVDHKYKSYDNLIENLIPYAPSFSWINYFTKFNNIVIKTPASIEDQRKKKCNIATVRNFYRKNKHIFENANPHLLWNADKSFHTSSLKFKVLAVYRRI